MKEIDWKILFELFKNSRLSDRQLAKKIGVSQPTITRRRIVLEREVLDGYTIIPRWEKMGYEIIAITFVKSKLAFASQAKKQEAIAKGSRWTMKYPNIIAAGKGLGMGWNGFMISVHKNYSDFEKFMTEVVDEMGEVIENMGSFLVGVTGLNAVKPFHLKYLADAKEDITRKCPF